MVEPHGQRRNGVTGSRTSTRPTASATWAVRSATAAPTPLHRASELSGIPVERIAENVKRVGASLMRKGGWDPATRLEDMDRAGIDGSVLYPSGAMFFGPVDPIKALHNNEFVRDCQRAYNDWLAEFCSHDRDRLFGIGLVPLQDIGMAVAEAEHVLELGLHGVVVRPSAYIDELPLSHSVYDPFWSACQELGIPVAFHPGVHIDTPGACRKFGLVVDDPDITVVNNTVSALYGGSGFGQAIGNAADMIITVGRLIMGGVCERFPSLRMIFLESGGGWMPTILERMDEQVAEFPLEGEHLSMQAERLLPPPVLRVVRGRRMEPRRLGQVAGRGPHPVGVGLPASPSTPTTCSTPCARRSRPSTRTSDARSCATTRSRPTACPSRRPSEPAARPDPNRPR